MKKVVLLSALISLFAVSAKAQWKVESVEKNNQYSRPLQVFQTDSSTLVFSTFTIDCDTEKWINLNRKGFVRVNGEKYKLLKSYGMPIYDEADKKWAYLPVGHNVINYILEYEKFPANKLFDLIDDENDEKRYKLNSYGISTTPIDSSEYINTFRFLESGLPVILGSHKENGKSYVTYLREGVFVSFNIQSFTDGWFSENKLFMVDIINGSDHGIMFDLDKVKSKAVKLDKQGNVTKEIDLKIFSPESYDNHIQQTDYETAKSNAGGIYNSIDKKISQEKMKTDYDSYARLGLEILQIFNKETIDKRTKQYMEEHPVTRPKGLRSQSIKPGESISGYIATQKKKADKIILTITMDGFDFEVKQDL